MWCWAIFLVGDMAGTGERMEHVAGDDRSAEGLNVLLGYMPRTTVRISPKYDYGSPEPNAVLPPAGASSTGFKASVRGTPSAEWGRRMYRFRRGGSNVVRPSGRMLAPPATVSAHTATTMTVIMSQSTASVTVAEVSSDGRELVREPRSTVVPPTAYARSSYSPYAGHARSCTVGWTGCGPSSARSCGATVL